VGGYPREVSQVMLAFRLAWGLFLIKKSVAHLQPPGKKNRINGRNGQNLRQATINKT
jgi:hypothetical protein